MNIELDDFLSLLKQQKKVKNQYIDLCAKSLKNGKRITQSDTARAIGVSHSLISLWINGKRDLSVKMLLAMVNYLEQEKGNEEE